jgi:tol-pal system protein YbgF
MVKRSRFARNKGKIVGDRTGARGSLSYKVGRRASNLRGLAVTKSIEKVLYLAAAISAGFWLSACVNPQQVELLEREQRRLRSDMTTLHTDVDGFRSTLADTRANIQQIQREISAIRERIDETKVQVGRQLGQTSREGDQRVKNMESRLAKLEEDAKAQGELLKTREAELSQLRDSLQAQAAQAAALKQGAGAVDLSLGESESVRRDYEVAWRALDKKDYRVAISRFREFLKKNPKSRLAPYAQYSIGESHLALKESNNAVVEFDEVRRKYPQSEKVAASLLGQGMAFTELGEKLNARLVLQELVEKYPQSPEAATARQRLKALES